MLYGSFQNATGAWCHWCHGKKKGVNQMPNDTGFLSWIEHNATRVVVQGMLPPYARQSKNRIVLEFRKHDGTVSAVGAPYIRTAVAKARCLQEAHRKGVIEVDGGSAA